MQVDLSNPTQYPYGLLSIYAREYGYSVADDAARVSVPRELNVVFPSADDGTYFKVLQLNIVSAIQTCVENHAIHASIHRIKKNFMSDIFKLKATEKPNNLRYTQLLFSLADAPIDPITGTAVDPRELAYIVASVRSDFAAGKQVAPANYTDLVSRYIKKAPLPDAPMKDLAIFTDDVNKIVEIVLEVDGDVTKDVLIQKIKDSLMNTFLDKILSENYPHLDPSQYQKAKDEQYLRHSTQHLEEKLFSLWENGSITLDPSSDISNEELDSMYEMPPEEMYTMSSEPPLLFNYPRLSLSYKQRFEYKGKFYLSPLEYGLKKCMSLFSEKGFGKMCADKMYNHLVETALAVTTDKIRTAIFSFMTERCRKPHMWVLLNEQKRIKWAGLRGMVPDEWLSGMYSALKKIPKPRDLSKHLDPVDFSTDPLVYEWFKCRVQLWRNVSVLHKNLFWELSAPFQRNTTAIRFPSADEKLIMTGCDSDVWHAISTEFKENFAGPAETVYTKILSEIGSKKTSFSNLCVYLTPYFEKDPRDFETVQNMMSAFLQHSTEKHMLVLWEAVFKRLA